MLMRYLGPRRFVFVANSKAASTSIHNSRLASMSQVRLATGGRHMGLDEVLTRFDVVFDRHPLEEFLTFGVIRDPVEWIVSWFNFRSRPELDRPERPALHYTGDMSFDEFWERYRGAPPYTPQSAMFRADGRVERVDVLVRFDRLGPDLQGVGDALGIRRLRVTRDNPSRLARITAADVPSGLRDEIRDVYRADYELIERLDADNEAGLRRYASRTAGLGAPPGAPTLLLRRLARGTRLEAPAKALAARLGVRTPGAREIATHRDP